MPCRVLLDQVSEAYSGGDRDALYRLYHDDALICSAAEPDQACGRDEMFARGDLLQRTQLIGPIELIPIDERGGMLRAKARTHDGAGSYRTTDRVWLLTFREGLVYRQRILDSREAATALYLAHGVDLDLPQPLAPTA